MSLGAVCKVPGGLALASDSRVVIRDPTDGERYVVNDRAAESKLITFPLPHSSVAVLVQGSAAPGIFLKHLLSTAIGIGGAERRWTVESTRRR